MMRAMGLWLFVVAAIVGSAQLNVVSAADETTLFDGDWNVTLTCPTHYDNQTDDAKGYTRQFPAEVKGGALRGSYGKPGQAGWSLLSGTIAPDGNANLKVDGIVGNQSRAANNAQRGKTYTYRVRAQFEASKGSGQRVGTRKCELTFVRR